MRRSAARARRRKSPTFYVDECLGRFVAASLAQAGVDVRPWYEHFAGSPDLEFLPLVGKNDWVFLTKDKNIRRNQLEVRAILNSGVRAFVVTATDLRREEMAALLLKAIPKMHRICHQRGPFVFNITETGLVTEVSRGTLRRRSRGRQPKR